VTHSPARCPPPFDEEGQGEFCQQRRAPVYPCPVVVISAYVPPDHGSVGMSAAARRVVENLVLRVGGYAFAAKLTLNC
jgi:hypothetical protein